MTSEGIQAAYNEYVPVVSTAVYACSLPITQYLYNLCEERKPKRLLDLGSGFSSYVLRSWAEANGAEHWAVDADAEWLDKTKLFLVGHDLDWHHTATWDKFTQLKLETFDLVFFDINQIAARSWYLRKALDMVADGGVLVADDCNQKVYREMVTEHASYYRRKCMYTDVVEVERDEWGRFPGRIDVSAEVNEFPPGVRPVLFAPLPYTEQAAHYLMHIAQRGFEWVTLPPMRTDRARDLAAWYLLDHPRYTHILMLDGDHEHPCDTPDKLLRAMVEDPSKLVVAGYNYRRGEPYDPMAWQETDGKQNNILNPTERYMPVRSVATCAIAIAREVFERIEPTWFGYQYPQSKIWDRVYRTDDVAFCDRCHAAGIQMWCATDCTAPHYTVDKVDRTYFERYIEREQHRIRPDGTFVIDRDWEA